MRKLKNEELNRLSVEGFKATEKLPISIILDNIRSMNNIGSAFRTADAFLIEKIYLTGICAQPPHRDIHKTALGATESVDWEYHASTSELVQALKKEGKRIVAIEQAENSTSLKEYAIPEGNSVYIFGNEVFGVSDDVMPLVDEVVEIPQFGTKHSLNISVSIGVVIWDLWSKMS